MQTLLFTLFIAVFLQMLRQGSSGIKSKQKAVFLLALFGGRSDMPLEFLVSNDHIVFLCELSYLFRYLQRIAQVYRKNPVEKTYDK